MAAASINAAAVSATEAALWCRLYTLTCEKTRIKVRVSGGLAGEGTDGEYEQEGEEVFVELEDEEFVALYDGETFELAQVQFYVWEGDAFFAAPPLEASESLDVGDRGRIVTMPTDSGNAVYLIDFVAGGTTVWLDASIWRNPDARTVLIDISERLAAELG